MELNEALLKAAMEQLGTIGKIPAPQCATIYDKLVEVCVGESIDCILEELAKTGSAYLVCAEGEMRVIPTRDVTTLD